MMKEEAADGSEQEPWRPAAERLERREVDRTLNPFRVANSDQLQDYIAGWRGQVEHIGRMRHRRPADQRTFEQQFEALAADVLYQHAVARGTWLRLSLSKAALGRRCRYKAPFVTEKLVDVLRLLEAQGHCEVELGHAVLRPDGSRGGLQTRVRLGPQFAPGVDALGLTHADFGLHEGEEVIVLKGPKGPGRFARAPFLQYEDTPRTIEMRNQLRRINAHLEAAPVEYVGGRQGVDASRRRLKRLFSDGSFDRHGRLYGGFWIDLPGAERLEDLTIAGSPVVALDYGQMSIRLLYAKAGVAPHFEDAYAVPGLEGHREGAKKLLNSVLAASAPLRRLPKDTRALLPRPMPVARALRLVADFHRPVAEHFSRGLMLELMYRESEIVVRVLLRLVDEGVTALPVHDSIVVAEEHEEAAAAAMRDCFREATGHEAVVRVER
jgi:hypothetical protein